ncbi:hypothetical protein G647_02083 [Cladophialophora carrionii CBS 160.54]|uniref:Uncharacterized protein n=1 Tax=Cladophialophora carrionii CBS 160.54 TaxID=1279043 RepID=V9DF42_9EURO|nr:uncharacterized protein G647_02083 [Cladophialophora carrionii CBS 160.54]ETI25311.1 hypothetical protein G647_02083 [Cladophialophora carrionii CBS 160.54]
MAKLQKTLKQRQRHAVRNSAHVAKLTPAEIRSLNNGALASRTGSQSSAKSTSSPARSRRSTNATPPATPDEPPAYQPQAHRNPVSRNNSFSIPTPPHTPSGHRRPSQSSTHGHHHHGHGISHGHASGVIHAPRPRGSVQAAFMSGNGISSRPSSSGSSTYRGLPTYRGPEVTRTGSVNMLQYPSHQIVNNPLSYFSRPRQSQISTSPELAKRGSSDQSIEQVHSLRNTRANSLPNVSAPSSRQPSPPRLTDSPVSIIVDGTHKFPAFDAADDPHNQPKIQGGDEDAQIETETAVVESLPKATPTVSDPNPKDIPVPESPRKEKDKQRRFTIHAALFGGDKHHHESPEKKLKKLRRRTLSLPQDEVSTEPPKKEPVPAAPLGEPAADGAAVENGDFATHPVVRPLSLTIPDGHKGKEKDITSAPVYARCSCCGRLKRPHGFNSELSPVLENENLRTNFSFEIERTSGSSARRSSDASRDKFTPILPMQVGQNETRQASIEPYNGPPEPQPEQLQHTGEMDMEIAASSPVRQPLRQKNASPIKLKRNSAPPGFVRFASLHGKRNGGTGPIFEEDEELELEADEHQPLMIEQTDMEDSTIQTRDFATMSQAGAVDHEIAMDRPDLQVSSAARAIVEPFSTAVPNDMQLITTGLMERTPLENPLAVARSDTSITSAQGKAPAGEDQPSRQDISQLLHRASIVDQSQAEPPVSDESDVLGKERPSPTSTTESPTSTTTTTTVTIITPTSATTATSTSMATSVAAPWEQELSASYLGGNNAMDLSLRPKFSFESMRSAIEVAEKEKDKDPASKATGKRKSALPGWMGVKA